MSATLISTFFNGDTTNESVTAIEQTLLSIYRKYDGMSYGNYEPSNTAAPNVLAGSALVVNQSLYRFETVDAINVLNIDGSTTALAEASDGDYYIVAVVGVDSKCTVYARLCSSVSVAYNTGYNGWYITATQQRVLGGFTKSGSVFNYKWRYQLNGSANEETEYNYRQYSDGLSAKLKVNSDSITIYSTSTPAQYATDIVPFATVEVKYPCYAAITANTAPYARTMIGNNSATAQTMCRYVATLLADDGSELAIAGETTLLAFGDSTSCLMLLPGKYTIKAYTSESTRTVSTTTQGRGGAVTQTKVYTSGLRINSLAVNLRNRLGAPIGKY